MSSGIPTPLLVQNLNQYITYVSNPAATSTDYQNASRCLSTAFITLISNTTPANLTAMWNFFITYQNTYAKESFALAGVGILYASDRFNYEMVYSLFRQATNGQIIPSAASMAGSVLQFPLIVRYLQTQSAQVPPTPVNPLNNSNGFPVATTTSLGVVKIGTGLVITSGGMVSIDPNALSVTTSGGTTFDTGTTSQYALISSLSTVATTGLYTSLLGRPTLGSAAALSVGTTAGTVAAGDDSRIVNAYPISNPVGYQTASDVTTALATVIGAAPAMLSTLASIVTKIQADEAAEGTLSTLVSTLTTQIANNTTAINTKLSTTVAATTYATIVNLNTLSASLATIATSGQYSDLKNLPSFALIANSGSASDLTSGVLSISVGGTGVTSLPALKTLLGVGTSAGLNIGTTAGTIAAGDDTRIINALSASTAATLYAPIASIPTPSTTTPLQDGVASIGTSTHYTRQDHIHPIDTTRLAVANNLSDVQSVSATRTNLGLGSAATANTAAFDPAGAASSAQIAAVAAAVATSVQKANNLSDLASVSLARTNLGLGNAATLNTGTTTGTLATGDDSRIVNAYPASNPQGFQTAIQVLNVLPVVPQAGTTTPLVNGTASPGVATSYSRQDHSHPSDPTRLVTTNNLSDLTNTTTARTNLGLNGAALLNVGTVTSTVAAGDDFRITGALSATNAIATYAPLISPSLSGIPTSPTATSGTNTLQIANTLFVNAAIAAASPVIPQAATTTPNVDGTATIGTSTLYARQDHIHPSDTTRLAVANNLSDLANITTARVNLGLGSAATSNNSAFDFAGAASSAQAAAIASAASSGLQKSSNLSDLPNVATARSNLGLGSAALSNTSAFDAAGSATAAQNSSLQKANNLSDVSSVVTTRSNLGLGGAAVLSVGTTTGTVAAGDDVRITGALSVSSAASTYALIAALPLAATVAPLQDGTATIGTSLLYARQDHIHPTDTSRIAVSSNLSDLSNATTARTNLGLGSAATANVTAFDAAGAAASAQTAAIAGAQATSLQRSSNLSDLASVVTARTNLGLGSAAVANTTAFDAAGSAASAQTAAVTAAQASSLQRASNLSDLASASTARTNLGLGTAALANSSAFDISGAAASVLASSLQSTNNLSDLTNTTTARTNLGLGSAATSAASAFDTAGAAATAQTNAVSTAQASSLQRSSNLSDLASATTARTNLGLGTAATANTTAFDAAGAATAAQTASLQKSNNLSDLASVTTARTNLGLGSAAVANTSAFDVAGAAAAVQATSLQTTNNLSDVTNKTTAVANLGIVPFSSNGGLSFATGRYYCPLRATANTNATTFTGQTYLIPISIPNAITATSLSIRLPSAPSTATNFNLGIYKDNNGVPSTLLTQTHVVSGTAIVTLTGSISIALTPGIYWLALQQDQNVNMAICGNSPALLSLLGVLSPNNLFSLSSYSCGYESSDSYTTANGLPTTLTNNFISTDSYPIIGIGF